MTPTAARARSLRPVRHRDHGGRKPSCRGAVAAVDIASGDTTPSTSDESDFGSTNITGGSVAKTFRLYNTGTANLTMDSAPADRVVLSGTSFTLTTGCRGRRHHAWQLRLLHHHLRSHFCRPAHGHGQHHNNDATGSENPYTFTIQGTGTSNVEIAVSGNATDIADNDTTPDVADHTDFGSATIGVSTVTRHVYHHQQRLGCPET